MRESERRPICRECAEGKHGNSGNCILVESVDQYGYGKARRFQGRILREHQITWLEAYGELPHVGQVIDHICHNPLTCRGGITCPHRACQNIRHMAAVTIRANVSRRSRSEPPTHCPRDHEYSPENTYINTKGAQVCRKCRAVWKARWKARRSALSAV